MTEQDRGDRATDRDLIIDRIYQIALEPSSLDGFIDLWHDMGLADHFVEADDEGSEHHGMSYTAHLHRAHSILQRDETVRSDLTEYVRPYKTLAACVVSGSLVIEAANLGAHTAYRIAVGDRLDQIGLPSEMDGALSQITRDVLNGPVHSEKILKVDLETKRGTILFRVTRLGDILDVGPAALIVSTHFQWQEALGAFISKVFDVTVAEQDIVRMLVEGEDAKVIAVARNTSEGTVRGQIKSIMRKMNVRSQTDIVRLAMTLGDFPTDTVDDRDVVVPTAPTLANNWLETEVWKPFKSLLMPDDRTLTYHDMGPLIGKPVLLSHMGSCMVRWSRSMVRLAFEHNLRVICPIRAGYGHSDRLDTHADPLDAAREDTIRLLDNLRIDRLPYIVQGTDFTFAADLVEKRPERISEIIGLGARPCLPGGLNVEGAGRWQRFFVSTARNAPHLVQFASGAVMAMCKRIGPEAMLRQLCKESPSDLRLLDNDEMKQILVANISLMAGPATNAARAFAMEYMAFQEDWSDSVMATRGIPVTLFLAREDPTIDLGAISEFQLHYPWIAFEVIEKAGLALIFQAASRLVPLIADAAKRVGSNDNLD